MAKQSEQKGFYPHDVCSVIPSISQCCLKGGDGEILSAQLYVSLLSVSLHRDLSDVSAWLPLKVLLFHPCSFNLAYLDSCVPVLKFPCRGDGGGVQWDERVDD